MRRDDLRREGRPFPVAFLRLSSTLRGRRLPDLLVPDSFRAKRKTKKILLYFSASGMPDPGRFGASGLHEQLHGELRPNHGPGPGPLHSNFRRDSGHGRESCLELWNFLFSSTSSSPTLVACSAFSWASALSPSSSSLTSPFELSSCYCQGSEKRINQNLLFISFTVGAIGGQGVW